MIYDISCKTLIGPIPFRIRVDKINKFIRIYAGTTYLFKIAWFWKLWYYLRQNQISHKFKKRYHILFSHYFEKIKVDSYDSFPIEKRMTLHNVIIDIKSVLNKDKNYCHYNADIWRDKNSQEKV